MLKADSGTLKSESELQARKTAPTIPSSVEWCWMRVTVLTISSIETLGKRLGQFAHDEALLAGPT